MFNIWLNFYLNQQFCLCHEYKRTTEKYPFYTQVFNKCLLPRKSLILLWWIHINFQFSTNTNTFFPTAEVIKHLHAVSCETVLGKSFHSSMMYYYSSMLHHCFYPRKFQQKWKNISLQRSIGSLFLKSYW